MHTKSFSTIITQHLIKKTPAWQTPCYVYSKDETLQSYKSLKSRLGTTLILSKKAIFFDKLLNAIAVDIDAVEVASHGELLAVETAKFKQVYLNTPALTHELISFADKKNINLVIDSLHQLKIYQTLKNKHLNSVILRLNSDIIKDFLTDFSSIRSDQFGMDASMLNKAMDFCLKHNIKIKGIHFFLGSNAFKETLKIPLVINKIVTRIEQKLANRLEMINFGGGFSAELKKDHELFNSYRKSIDVLNNHYKIFHESGRAIAATGGVFIVKVVQVKHFAERIIVVCDGGIAQNFLLCLTESFLKKYQQPELVVRDYTNNPVITTKKMQLVGSSCSKDDVIGLLATGAVLPRTGDYYIFKNCGAYNSYTVSDFLSLSKTNYYLV